MNQIMQAYTINEVSKQLNIPPGTLRQWEKDLKDILVIPRSKNGARYYTDEEISLLDTVKKMRNQNLSQKMIRRLLKQHLDSNAMTDQQESPLETSLNPILHEATTKQDHHPLNIEQLSMVMTQFQDHLLQEIKQELNTSFKKEVVDEMKMELSKNSLHTVKTISDSIYKSNEKTKAEIQEMTDEWKHASKQSSGALETLSKRVAKQSKRTTDQMHYITNKITESSEASSEEFKTMIHYISSSQELTGTEFSNEINELKESMNADRDIYVETMRKEHEEYLHRLREREDAFQDMMLSFRDAAASKQEKKWWQKWKK
ncbi:MULTISPECIES: MerR family transcriptional regulator [Cytobacillus]|uniref:MerR family transcriptional regulator n=1 Tax=Cytobacillus stercorigallinarum TaxID=2762240 RepID=A0ABR8QQH7_9BACI|nr:MerR family transcriptional regulator [Cytobacillus stercorigallinarum]MBD7937796.1 MerR family transcriptional regulator [Cytobacillus stercorigallinarum]